MGFYRTIHPSELRPADIILSTTRHFNSGAIRTGTGSDFSHAILYIGNNQVIEAVAEGVGEKSLTQALFDGSLAVAIRRRGMDELSKLLVVQTARDFKGRPYDYVGAVAAGVSHGRGQLAAAMVCSSSPTSCLSAYLAARRNARADNRDKMFFCSELVARCFEYVGKPVTDTDSSFVTPRALRVSQYCIYVGHLLGGT